MKCEHITSQQTPQAASFQVLHGKDAGQDDRNLLSLFHARRDKFNKTQNQIKILYLLHYASVAYTQLYIYNIYIYILLYI